MFIKDKDTKPNQFKYIAIIGLWDIMHEGHKYGIKRAFDIGENIIIGIFENATEITGVHKFVEYIESFETRMGYVRDYIENELKPTKPYEMKNFKTEVEATDYFNEQRGKGLLDAVILSQKDLKEVLVQGIIKFAIGFLLKKKVSPCKLVILDNQKDENGKIYSSSDIRAKQYIKDKCPNLYKTPQTEMENKDKPTK
jgi:phosphopantetheine adenylyltransferase